MISSSSPGRHFRRPISRARVLLLVAVCAAALVLPAGTLRAQSTGSLSGFVKDAETHEALPGANVFIRESSFGVATNLEGYFVISAIPPGIYELVVSFIGYQPETRRLKISAGDKVVRDYYLQPQSISLDSVIVSAEREAAQQDIRISEVGLTTQRIQTMPRVIESDVFRSLQYLPGVIAPSDYSTGLVVRGGNTDQNLITLDGITVYNPSHVGGLFSNFITDAIKDAKLLKGGFPAEYGGRLSSVLRLTSREGNSRRFSGSAAVSLLSAQTTVEGPLAKGAWLLSLRRTYIDQVLNAARELNITDFELPYYFYDAQGHIFQDFSYRDRVSVSAYLGRDVLDWEDLTVDLNWGNRTIALNWRHLFSDRLFSNFMIAASRFDTKVGIGGDGGAFGINEIRDNTLKGDLTYFLSNEHEIKLGIEAKDLWFEYRNEFDNRDQGSSLQQPVHLAGYVQDIWKPSLRLILQPGLRLNYFSIAADKWRPEPRMAAKYLLGANSSLSLSWGLYNQYLTTVQDELNPTIIDFWFSFDETLASGHAAHYVAGYETVLPFWDLSLTLEAYYKTMDNLLAFKRTRSSFTQEVDFTIVNIFRKADAEAYGAELLLERRLGRLNGWLSYSFSHVYKEGETINDQFTRYPPNWDRRHALSLVADYHLSRNWSLGAIFKYGSGFPYTQASGSFEYQLIGTPADRRVIFDTVNGARYPDYHRLDFTITRHYDFKSWVMDLSLNLVNLYNRDNVFYYVWDFDENPAERDSVPLFPFFPSIGVSAKF